MSISNKLFELWNQKEYQGLEKKMVHFLEDNNLQPVEIVKRTLNADDGFGNIEGKCCQLFTRTKSNIFIILYDNKSYVVEICNDGAVYIYCHTVKQYLQIIAALGPNIQSLYSKGELNKHLEDYQFEGVPLICEFLNLPHKSTGWALQMLHKQVDIRKKLCGH